MSGIQSVVQSVLQFAAVVVIVASVANFATVGVAAVIVAMMKNK